MQLIPVSWSCNYWEKELLRGHCVKILFCVLVKKLWFVTNLKYIICGGGVFCTCHVFFCLFEDFINIVIPSNFYLPLWLKIYFHSQVLMEFSLFDYEQGLSSIFILNMLIIPLTNLEYTWDIFRFSTCHRMLHCEASVFLFTKKSPYGFISKPQYFRVPLIFFQNNNATCRVPCSDFFSLVYMTGIHF